MRNSLGAIAVATALGFGLGNCEITAFASPRIAGLFQAKTRQAAGLAHLRCYCVVDFSKREFPKTLTHGLISLDSKLAAK